MMTDLKNKIKEAIKKAKQEKKKGKFTHTVELIINLKDVDIKKPENRINEEIMLPHGTEKERKIAVFAGGELAEKAKGKADLVLDKDDIEELAKNKRKARKLANEYDFFLAQTDYMPLVGRALGPILGPRGKLPKPITPNMDIAPLIERLRKTVKVRTKDNPVVHLAIGKETMDDDKLAENAYSAIEAIERKLPRGIGNIRNMYVKTTMGKSIKVQA